MTDQQVNFVYIEMQTGAVPDIAGSLQRAVFAK
jgi:hypothetical protein